MCFMQLLRIILQYIEPAHCNHEPASEQVNDLLTSTMLTMTLGQGRRSDATHLIICRMVEMTDI